MSLNFIQKLGAGGTGKIKEDVAVSALGDTYASISFNEDAIRTISDNCELPKGIMIAIQDNRIYFVPVSKNTPAAFVLNHSAKKGRPSIKISKKHGNLSKFTGRYNFHFDEKEGAYYIDRKFLLAQGGWNDTKRKNV